MLEIRVGRNDQNHPSQLFIKVLYIILVSNDNQLQLEIVIRDNPELLKSPKKKTNKQKKNIHYRQ